MNATFANAQKSTSAALESMQKLAQFNWEFMQASLADLTKNAQAVFAMKSPQEFTDAITAEMKAAPEKAAAYGRQVRDILTPSTKR
jgi:phasin family protein